MMQNTLRRWQSLWHPERFHGWGKQRSYFEGWYYKLVSADESHAFALIPGISYDQHGKAEAFIQVLDGKTPSALYYPFEADAFRPASDRFALQVGANFFSESEIRLDLPALSGAVTMHKLSPWPSSLGAPGIMGWYSFVPFMECYHAVVSMNHKLGGELNWRGESVSLDGGKGYSEKDWGRSFPSAWVWMQSNNFDLPDTSLMASVARIPWLGRHFIGHIVGFLHQGELIRFSTYAGDRYTLETIRDGVKAMFSGKAGRLEVIARGGQGGDLLSPVASGMKGKVNESMQGQLDIRFFQKGTLQLQAVGRNAGFEMGGYTEQLLNS